MSGIRGSKGIRVSIRSVATDMSLSLILLWCARGLVVFQGSEVNLVQ